MHTLSVVIGEFRLSTDQPGRLQPSRGALPTQTSTNKLPDLINFDYYNSHTNDTVSPVATMTSVHAETPPPIVTDPSGINYATGSALGKGGFAICHRAERYDSSKPTGQMVALKIVKTNMEPAKLAQKVC